MVPLIACRHTGTGAEADIPETALKHLGAYEPVDPEDRKRLGYDRPAETPADSGEGQAGEGGGDEPPGTDDPTRQSKPATGAAKKK